MHKVLNLISNYFSRRKSASKCRCFQSLAFNKCNNYTFSFFSKKKEIQVLICWFELNHVYGIFSFPLDISLISYMNKLKIFGELTSLQIPFSVKTGRKLEHHFNLEVCNFGSR